MAQEGLVLSMENGATTQRFGKLMYDQGLIHNHPSTWLGRRIEYIIPYDYEINHLIEFIKQYDAFNWNMKCYEETN